MLAAAGMCLVLASTTTVGATVGDLERHASTSAATRITSNQRCVGAPASVDPGCRRPYARPGDAKLAFGRKLAKLALEANPDLSEAKREKEQRRYEFAPLVLVVSAKIDTDSKVPELEQDLTAGCVAYNILLGAQALGYGAQWLTGWPASSPTRPRSAERNPWRHPLQA